MIRGALAALAILATSACALVDGNSRKLDVADSSGVSLDITRRAIHTPTSVSRSIVGAISTHLSLENILSKSLARIRPTVQCIVFL